MKIAVQGKIIDTENIYCIGEVQKNYTRNGSVFEFEITSFNDNSFLITIPQEEGFDRATIISDPNLTREEKTNTILSKIDDNKERIEKMRQAIIDIWSQNQTKIPSFDIKNF